MRKRMCFIYTIIVAALILNSCFNMPSDHNQYQSGPSTNGYISTNTVQYCGWQDYISDGTYVIASEGFQTGVITKYNLATGNITNVCMKNGCRHLTMSFEHTMSDNCPIPLSSKLFFVHNQKIYYTYDISHFDEQELEEFESTKLLRRNIFASYDLTTGEQQNILEVERNDYEQLYTFKLVGDYIYYFRYIAQVEKPSTADDYKLCLCRMKVDEYRQEILFDLSSAFPDYPQRTLPMLLAVDNGNAYFVCNLTGSVFYCSLSGENGKYLINAEKEGFWGIYDAYGTFYSNGYIYFAKYVQEPQKALYLYRMDTNTGEKVVLTDDYVKWFFVADDAIYYEMSQAMQPSEAQQNEAGMAGTYRYTIKQMKLDGTDSHIIGHIDAPYAETARPWGVGNKFFIQMRFRKNISETTVTSGHYDVIFDVTDGTVIEVGKSEEMK